jgi:hypothetical protein
MKLYSRYFAARKAAAGRPILRIGQSYLVGDFEPHTQVEVIVPDGTISGQVGLAHLERLGNANHATASQHWTRNGVKAFCNQLIFKTAPKS